MKLKQIILSILASIVFLANFCGAVLAVGSASLGLLGGGTYEPGDTVSVAITENSGSVVVNAIQVDISYDSSKLQYLGFSATLPCPIVNPNTGLISIGCSVTGGGGVSGNQSVGTASFKALADSGATSLTLAQTSMIVRQDDASDVWSHGPVATSVNFSTPAPSAPESTETQTSDKTSTSTNDVQRDNSRTDVEKEKTAENKDEEATAPNILEEEQTELVGPEVEYVADDEGQKMLLLTAGVLGLVWLSRWLTGIPAKKNSLR